MRSWAGWLIDGMDEVHAWLQRIFSLHWRNVQCFTCRPFESAAADERRNLHVLETARRYSFICSKCLMPMRNAAETVTTVTASTISSEGAIAEYSGTNVRPWLKARMASV